MFLFYRLGTCELKWVTELAPGPKKGFLISSSSTHLLFLNLLCAADPLPSLAIPLPSSPLNHNRMVPFSAQSQFANWKIARLSGIRQSPTWPRFNPSEKPDDGQLQDDPGHFQCLQQDDGHFQCLQPNCILINLSFIYSCIALIKIGSWGFIMIMEKVIKRCFENCLTYKLRNIYFESPHIWNQVRKETMKKTWVREGSHIIRGNLRGGLSEALASLYGAVTAIGLTIVPRIEGELVKDQRGGGQCWMVAAGLTPAPG